MPSPSKKLSENTASFLVARQAEKLCMFIIDGNQFNAPLMTAVYPEHDNEEILIQSIIALVRQYEANAADGMKDFLYAKQEEPLIDENLMNSASVRIRSSLQYYPYTEVELI